MKCPRCESTKYSFNGTTKAGTPRYRCSECGKSWSDRPIGRPPVNSVAMTNAERQKRFRERQKRQKNN